MQQNPLGKTYKFWHQYFKVECCDLTSEAFAVEAFQVAVRVSEVDMSDPAGLLRRGFIGSSADFFREAVRDKLGNLKVVGVQDVDSQEAERLIED